MTGQEQEDAHVLVDQAIQEWQQGDCILEENWLVFRFNPDNPITEDSRELAKEEVDLAESPVRGFVVTSQTCDIVRFSQQRPYIEVSPLVEIDPAELPSIERERRPQYALVPGTRNQNLVADLDRSMCLEKSVLLGTARVAGCTTDQERRAFARALARKRTRFAFPDDFVHLVDRLQKKISRQHDRDSDDGRALRALREIRVRAAPAWDSGAVEIQFYFVRNDDEPEFEGKTWDQHCERWLGFMKPEGRFEAIDGVVTTLDNITARDYVESDPLDLDHLSSLDD